METKQTTEVLSGNALQDFFDGKITEETTEEVKTEITDFFDDKKEEVVIVPKEVKTEIAPVVETQTNSAQTEFYRNLITEYITEGDWQDGEVQIGEGDDAVSIPISELKEITPEIFKALKEQQKALKDEDFNTKYVSVEGLDENTRKMIDIKKAGGDIRSLLEVEANFVHPFKNLNLEDENVQANIVYQKYLHLSGGDEDIAKAKVDKLRANLQLDAEAGKIISEVDANFTAQVEQKKQEQLEKNKEILNNQKEYKKVMSDTIKGLGVTKESISKNLLKNLSEFDEYGVTPVDKLFFQTKDKNPELFAKVSLMLTDEEAYNELYGTKIKNAVKKETINNVFKLTPKTSHQTPVSKKGNEVDNFLNT